MNEFYFHYFKKCIDFHNENDILYSSTKEMNMTSAVKTLELVKLQDRLLVQANERMVSYKKRLDHVIKNPGTDWSRKENYVVSVLIEREEKNIERLKADRHSLLHTGNYTTK